MAENKSRTGYVVFLSIVAALGGILFGYDTGIISGTTLNVQGQFGLDEIQKGWYVGCALVGSIIGVACAGFLSDYLGRKKTMIIAAILFSATGFGCGFAGSVSGLVAWRIIGGMGIGIVSIVSPMYISEVSPAKIRGTMVSLYQLAVTLGLLLSYLANFLIAKGTGLELLARLENQGLWREMLGSEVLPALIFFIVIFFIPESPRWLMVKGCENKAMDVFRKLKTNESGALEEFTLTKNSISSEVKGEWSAFKSRGLRKAVLFGCCIAILGQFMGVNAVLYYGPEIFTNAGLAGEGSMLSTVLVGLVNFLTTILAVFIIDKVGRKKLIYFGVSGMIFCLLGIAAYFAFGDKIGLGPIFLLVFFMLYIFSQAISISAVVFVLLSEMYPNKVRGIAMSIAGFALWIGTYLIGQFTPVCMKALTPAGTFLLFAVMCLPYMYIMWKKIPETTGKSLEEIEEFWKKQD